MTLTKTVITRQKNDKDLMSTADPANLFGKIWIAQKQGLLSLKWVQRWVKRGWKSRLQ
jgi:hypothetical protein